MTSASGPPAAAAASLAALDWQVHNLAENDIDQVARAVAQADLGKPQHCEALAAKVGAAAAPYQPGVFKQDIHMQPVPPQPVVCLP
jgi:hypothetical protein